MVRILMGWRKTYKGNFSWFDRIEMSELIAATNSFCSFEQNGKKIKENKG